MCWDGSYMPEPEPEKRYLICFRNYERAQAAGPCLKSNTNTAWVGWTLGSEQYDVVFMAFEPATDKEFQWFHTVVKPACKPDVKPVFIGD